MPLDVRYRLVPQLRRGPGVLLGPAPLRADEPVVEAVDPRDIRPAGRSPTRATATSPTSSITDDGHWLCVMTTGKGVEGEAGQHIVATRSADRGRTWSGLVPIEPADGPEASWAMPLKVPGGRVYVFYTYNADNLRAVPAGNSPKINRRVDTLGQYCFKFSDDGGRTWSRERFEIPMRRTRIDRENNTRGEILFFWGVGKPIAVGDAALFGFAKVGKWGTPGTMVTPAGRSCEATTSCPSPTPPGFAGNFCPTATRACARPRARCPTRPTSRPWAMARSTPRIAPSTAIPAMPTAATAAIPGRLRPTPPTPPAGGGSSIPARRTSCGSSPTASSSTGSTTTAASRSTPDAWNHYLGRNPAWICGGVEKDG